MTKKKSLNYIIEKVTTVLKESRRPMNPSEILDSDMISSNKRMTLNKAGLSYYLKLAPNIHKKRDGSYYYSEITPDEEEPETDLNEIKRIAYELLLQELKGLSPLQIQKRVKEHSLWEVPNILQLTNLLKEDNRFDRLDSGKFIPVTGELMELRAEIPKLKKELEKERERADDLEKKLAVAKVLMEEMLDQFKECPEKN